MAVVPLLLTGGDPYKNTNRLPFSIIVFNTELDTLTNKQFARRIQTNLNPYFPKSVSFLNNLPEVDPVGTSMGGTLERLFPNIRFQNDFLLVEAEGAAGGAAGGAGTGGAARGAAGGAAAGGAAAGAAAGGAAAGGAARRAVGGAAGGAAGGAPAVTETGAGTGSSICPTPWR